MRLFTACRVLMALIIVCEYRIKAKLILLEPDDPTEDDFPPFGMSDDTAANANADVVNLLRSIRERILQRGPRPSVEIDERDAEEENGDNLSDLIRAFEADSYNDPDHSWGYLDVADSAEDDADFQDESSFPEIIEERDIEEDPNIISLPLDIISDHVSQNGYGVRERNAGDTFEPNGFGGDFSDKLGDWPAYSKRASGTAGDLQEADVDDFTDDGNNDYEKRMDHRNEAPMEGGWMHGAMNKRRGYQPDPRNSISMPQTIYARVGVILFIDNSLYRYHKGRNGDNKQKAIGAIKEYYGAVFAMANQIYMNIKDPYLNMRLVISGILIAEVPLDRAKGVKISDIRRTAVLKLQTHGLLIGTKDNSIQKLQTCLIVGDRQSRADVPWIEYLVKWTRDTGGKVNANKALEKFRVYLKKNMRKLPKYDHAVSFTRYKLVNSRDSGVEGMTQRSAMCKTKDGSSSSIIHDRGDFNCYVTLAHEIGHSLGASHDGDSKNRDCPSRGNYIMAPIHSTGGSFLANTQFFSRCSIRQMNELLRAQGECVLDNPVVHYRHDFEGNLPGRKISANEQCSLSFGPFFVQCPAGEIVKKMCVSLWCMDSRTPTTCTTRSSFAALPGTKCGDGMICYGKECREDTGNWKTNTVKARPLPQSSGFAIDSNKKNHCKADENPSYCKQIVRAKPDWCIRPSVRVYCCHSCIRARG